MEEIIAAVISAFVTLLASFWAATLVGVAIGT
jgi:hypothetical protein